MLFFPFLLGHSSSVPGTGLSQMPCTCYCHSDSTAWIVFWKVGEGSLPSQESVEGCVCAGCCMSYVACCIHDLHSFTFCSPICKDFMLGRGGKNQVNSIIASRLIRELGCEVGTEFRFKWKTNKSRTWISAIRNLKWNVFMQSELSFYFFLFQSPLWRRAGKRAILEDFWFDLPWVLRSDCLETKRKFQS